MLMQPSQGWRWYFDQLTDRLSVALDEDLHFKTHYRGKQLCPMAKQPLPFSTEDSAHYNRVIEILLAYKLLPTPLLVQCGLNAVAARRFLLPSMPKSWFFTPGAGGLSVQPEQLVELQTLSGEIGQFIILESNEQASLCMLVDETLRLNDSKTMQMFDTIKVMNDRLLAYVTCPQTINPARIA